MHCLRVEPTMERGGVILPNRWEKANVVAQFGVLAVAIAAAYVAWLQWRSPPQLELIRPRYVLVRRKPHIGLPVPVINRGGRPGTITGGRLTLQRGSDRASLELKVISPSMQTWTYDPDGRPKGAPFMSELFSTFTVGGGGYAQPVFWFTAGEPGFQFTEGDYTLIAQFGVAEGDELVTPKISFHVSQGIVEQLKPNVQDYFPVEAK